MLRLARNNKGGIRQTSHHGRRHAHCCFKCSTDWICLRLNMLKHPRAWAMPWGIKFFSSMNLDLHKVCFKVQSVWTNFLFYTACGISLVRIWIVPVPSMYHSCALSDIGSQSRMYSPESSRVDSNSESNLVDYWPLKSPETRACIPRKA